uniref:Inositol 1,4,5-trisphosphate/ryanodine receptor domain-containing protein n=1 Tax=Amphimedon queenslandica TaxID=400682 RepID=A0A1X7UHI3_AMPQE
MEEGTAFVREGDTILLSYEVKGQKLFLYSMQPIRSKDKNDRAYEAWDKYAFNQPSLHPLAYDEIKERAIPPNVHYLSFKVIPELLSEESFQDDTHVRKDTSYCMKLVYGRKIKLLHMGSKMYLSLSCSSEGDKYITFRPEYDERTCLFIVHLPNEEKQFGDAVCSGDTIFLKSSFEPSYIVSNEDDNKLSVSDSICDSIGFTVSLHRSVKANSGSIRGGSVVRLSCLETDAFLHGEGSTLDPSIWTRGLEHFRQEGLFKVGFTQKRKLPNGVHKPLPVSGDCYWLLEKWDKPLDGTPFKFDDKCSLRHLQTQRYLALNNKSGEFELVAVNGIGSRGYQYKFIIEPATPNTDSSIEEVQQDSEIMLKVADSKSNAYLSLDTKKKPFRDSKKRQISTQWLRIVKCSDLSDDCVTRKKCIIKVGEVEKKSLFKLYFAKSVKSILQEILVRNPVPLEEYALTLNPNDEETCLDVLQCVSKWLKKGLSTTRKTRGKISRSSEVIALLVNFLCVKLSDRICTEIASILTDFIKIHSHRSHLYFIHRPQPCDMSLADVVASQLTKNSKIQMILYHLLERQSGVADTVALSLLNSKFLDRITWPLTINDKTIIEIFAMLCTPNGIPFEEMQKYICTELENGRKEIPIFKIVEDGVLYHVNGGSFVLENFSENAKVKINYFISLLDFFAALCKGGERVSSDFVKKHCPFDTSCLYPGGLIDSVVNDSVLCNKLKSAYLKCIISAYIEPKIENSGIDIDNIWHCYFWSKVKKTNKTSRPLYASNVAESSLMKHEHIRDIVELLKQCITIADCKLTTKSFFLSDLMELFNTLIAYGLCWNCKTEVPDNFFTDDKTELKYLINDEGDEVFINLPLLVQMLDGRDDTIMIAERGVDVGYSYRQENLSLFRLKVNIIKVLHSFLKQLIYLGLEKFLLIFATEEGINPGGVKSLFSDLKLYECFDIADPKGPSAEEPKGPNLKKVLECLMHYPNDELRQASVALLIDIHDMEHKMIEDAKNSYLIFKEDSTVTDFTKRGSFTDANKSLLVLIQGLGNIRTSEDLKWYGCAMVKKDNKNNIVPRRRIQMLAYTSGIFSALMVYVLKFSQRVCHANTNQLQLLNRAFKFLQLMCQGNKMVKAKIFVSIPQLLKVRTGVAAVAHLLAEVFEKNRELCLRMSNNDIECMYTLASTYHSDSSEYLKFFKTLGILMKPDTEGSILIHQQFLFRLFLDSYHDCFSDVLSSEGISNAVNLLKESSQKDEEVIYAQNKLLCLTEFLAACSERYQFAKDKCCEFFSLHHLINIIINNGIDKNFQKPFVHFLEQVYLCNKRQLKHSLLIMSLKQVVSQLQDNETSESRPLYLLCLDGKQLEEVKELPEDDEEIQEMKINEDWQNFVANIAVNTSHIAGTSGSNANQLLQLYEKRFRYLHPKRSGQEKLVEIFEECMTEIKELIFIIEEQLQGSSEENNVILVRATHNMFQIFGVFHQCIIKMNDYHFNKLKSNLQFLFLFSPHDVERFLLLSKKEDVSLYILAFFAVFFLYNGENDSEKERLLEIRSVAIGNRNLFNIIGRQIQRATAELNKPGPITQNSRLSLPDSHFGSINEDSQSNNDLSINEDSQSNNDLTGVHVDQVPKVELKVETGTDLIWQAGLSLDVISAMCSGQKDEMQDKMRLDPSTGIHFVRDTAILLSKLANLEIHSSLIECKTKAIQALIEMCNGNIENKKVALDGQVIDSINLILSTPCNVAIVEIEEQKMQGVAIKLLQILLEETCKESKKVIQMVCTNLKKDKVVKFIVEIFGIYKIDRDDNSQIHDLSSHLSAMRQAVLKAYHVLRTVEDHDKSFNFTILLSIYLEKCDKTIFSEKCDKQILWNILSYLEERSHRIEVFYEDTKGSGILTRVYFPYAPSLELSETEKHIFKHNVNREDIEDRQENLILWTKSAHRNFTHKSKLKKIPPLFNVLFGFFSELFNFLLILLTILLNLLILSLYIIPDSVIDQQGANSSIVIITKPNLRLASYFYWRHVFTIPHLLLSLWMTAQYFITEKKNFIVIPYGLKNARYKIEMWVKKHFRYFYKKILRTQKTIFAYESYTKCYEFNLLSFGTLYRLIFVLCSILAASSISFGYLYCICIPYTFMRLPQLQNVKKTLEIKKSQLFSLTLVLFALLWIYAIISFTFLYSFFDVNQNLFCDSLFECYITVLRVGLFSSFGGSIPSTYVNQPGPDFTIFAWRAIIDVSYYLIITLIILPIAIGIFNDGFSKLNNEMAMIEQDQKDRCFVCGIENDVFEKHVEISDRKESPFWVHMGHVNAF